MSFISNFLFAVAMLINVNISSNFNIAFLYYSYSIFLPSILIFLSGRYKVKDLVNEFELYDKKYFLLSALTWCLMLIASVKAYEVGDVILVAPLLTLTSILNTIYEFVICKKIKK
ncbi:MAG: hypothetical protein L6V81_04680 [Clostridium sp.]|nr:MAG: hypothetical protein L6V81_04680 [Clostridium sp.]